jgi:hypothetical protein
MAETLISPGVFLQENDQSQIQQGPITVGAAIIGPTVYGPVNIPTVARSYSDFKAKFGASFVSGGTSFEYLTSIAALNYFNQGGETLLVTRVVSGTYSSATASVGNNIPSINGTVASASISASSAANYASWFTANINVPTQAGILSYQITNDPYIATGSFYVSTNGIYLGTGDGNGTVKITTPTQWANFITQSINAPLDSYGYTNPFYPYFTASFNSATSVLTVKTKTAGAYPNASYSITSSYYYGSTNYTSSLFAGGTDSIGSTAFTLETISQGTLMNNDFSASAATSSLQSGSANNVRYEVSFCDTGSGLFTLVVRRGDDYQQQKNVLETWNNLSLDPNQANYISYVIGDQTVNYAQDETGAYYLQYSGSYPNQSRYIRVKSVLSPTPNYLDNQGRAQSQYTASMPAVGSGSANGSFGGAVGNTIQSAGMNLFENIPVADSVATSPTTNIQGVFKSDYSVAIGLLGNKDQYDFKTISAPGLTVQNASSKVSDLLSLSQTRGTSISVVDMTSYAQNITTATQKAQTLDSSYGATYWPWVQLRSQETGKLFFCPASTIVPAVYEYSDKISAEWFAPAGLTRGGLTTVIQPERRLTVGQRDILYAASVNPIAIFPGQGTVIYGQKTLQTKPTALDRVGVRRLLIALKRYIGNIAEGLVFEQNTQSTRNNFLNQVNPYLQYVQQKQGLYAFKVVMDDSNNTPDVIDRNQLVGAIYLQPTRTAEFIMIDFNVQPTGTTFGV